MGVDGAMGPATDDTPAFGGQRDRVWARLNAADKWILGRAPESRLVNSGMFAGLAVIAFFKARSHLENAVAIQFAGTGENLTELLDDATDDAVITHLQWDLVFILTAVIGGLLLSSLVNSRSRARPSVRLTAYALVLAAGVFDVVEDIVTWTAVRADTVGHVRAQLIAGLAGVKFLLIGALLLLVLGAAGRRLVPSVEADRTFLGQLRRPVDPTSTVTSAAAHSAPTATQSQLTETKKERRKRTKAERKAEREERRAREKAEKRAAAVHWAEAADRWFIEARADTETFSRQLQRSWTPVRSSSPSGDMRETIASSGASDAPEGDDANGQSERDRSGIGIACSGGGIRSASFSLGALHGLGPKIVRRADYLSAASGGAYIASAMTAHEYGRQDEAEGRTEAAAQQVADVERIELGPPGPQQVSSAIADTAAGVLRYAAELTDPSARSAGLPAQVEMAAARLVDQAYTEAEKTVAKDVQKAAVAAAALPAPDSPLPFGQQEDRLRPPAPDDLAPFRWRDSEELARLRARVSYLLLNGAEGRVSIFRAVSGILINLFVIGLVLFALARPIGYAMSSPALHPELRANYPLLHDVRLVQPPVVATEESGETNDEVELEDLDLTIADFTLGAATEVDCADDAGPGSQVPVSLTGGQHVAFDATEHVDGDPESYAAAHLRQAEPGVIEVCAGRVAVVQQPALEVTTGAAGLAVGLTCEKHHRDRVQQPCVAEAIEVDTPSLLKPTVDVLVGEEFGSDDAAALVEVDEQPTFTSEFGGQGREDISIDGWMWFTAIGALVFGMLGSTFGIGPLRGRHELTTALPTSSRALLGLAGVTFTVAIALPWLSQELPARFGDATSALPGAAEGVWGFIIWLGGFLAAARAALAGLRKEESAKTSSGKRKSRLVLKIGALAFLAFTGFIALFTVLQSPVLNGPNGQIHGGTWYWDWDGLRQPDVGFLAGVVLVLVLLRRLVPTYLWSLNPLYRDRLGKAFLGDSRDQKASKAVREMDILGTPEPTHPWPELVVCAAVNLNSADPENRIPSGRWADSFTFSREAIGSPSTTYVPSTAYQEALSDNRHTDLQLSSLVAVSGAAFSPGMGKEAYGALGGLLAVLNLRLGLWLPSPAWVSTMNARRQQKKDSGKRPSWWWIPPIWRVLRNWVLVLFRKKPPEDPKPYTWRSAAGWPYLLREIFGRFRRTSPYVYVTDGGHWENLGLVELIRRGCTEIYVLSAAGDGTQSFATAGEAIALAREQFGVDIHIELTPLRARSGGDPPKEGRQLLDLEAEGKERAFAAAPYAVGWFEYANGVKARILFIEAALTDDLPWDVHSHAERHSIFPDDSTMNQFFNHRQFESYRRLGSQQAQEAMASDEWRWVDEWRHGQISETWLREILADYRGERPDPEDPA